MSYLKHRPVYPIVTPMLRAEPSLGISMHQHYAGLAMQALITSPTPMSAQEIAKWSVMMASMMIEELEAK
jgi:hypothetical protein